MRIKKLDLDLLPQMRSKELAAKRRVLSKTLEGTWTAMLKGRGMEFAGFRQYTTSDDASRIDWGASLRANETLVREFEEFKNVNVLLLLDVSDTMLCSSQKKLKAEFAAELAFNLGVSILDNGDSVGYAMFADTVVAKSLPDVGRAVVYNMAGTFSKPALYGGKKDFSRVVSLVDGMLKHRALIILVSDFISMGEYWDRYVRMLAEKFDLIGVMVRDPRDSAFPDSSNQMLLEDPYSGERMFVDVKDYGSLFAEQAQKEEEYVKGVFEAAKAGFVKVETSEEDIFQPVVNYFRRRSAVVRG